MLIHIFILKLNGTKKTGPPLTCKEISSWVTEKLGISEEDSFSDRTICNWLHKMGFNINVQKKGIYLDGHERKDVIEDRNEFLKKYARVREDCIQYDDNTDPMVEIPNPNAKRVLVSLDEKAHHSNDHYKR